MPLFLVDFTPPDTGYFGQAKEVTIMKNLKINGFRPNNIPITTCLNGQSLPQQRLWQAQFFRSILIIRFNTYIRVC
jgi:hypothetical protein